MLAGLTIDNVALIEHAQIDFTHGLNVLSGETGSGKSVILDSINFVLGAKADKSMIRYGEQSCSVRAEFAVKENSAAYKTLAEMDLDPEETVVISRKYNRDGKGSIKVNGCPVSATMLKRITQELVDVHGQSEHFYLLQESNQLKLLDRLCGEKLSALKAELAVVLGAVKADRHALESIGGDPAERARRAEILQFQIEEIESVAEKQGERQALEERRTFLANVGKISSALSGAYQSFSSGITDGILSALHCLRSISHLAADYAELCDRLENLRIEADDLSACLEAAADDLTYDESEADTVEQRLEELSRLHKKYGKTTEDVTAFLEKAKQEYDLITHSDEEFAKINARIEANGQKAAALCRKMTLVRKETAARFAAAVIAELKTLNIKNASFCVDFAEYSDEACTHCSEAGADKITFLFSANAGEPVKPMSKIISGGEMSRFMLAVKTQTGDPDGISTYIFDEIDAGISGVTARVVAEKFAKIARDTQIIAVSHLAQIAAMSDNELLISKHTQNDKTTTSIQVLSGQDRVREIVRLIGGNAESAAAHTHAQELLAECEAYKKNLVTKK